MRPAAALFLLPLFAAASPASQLPPRDNLKDGEGVALVREHCLYCHDDSYIVSANLSREHWQEVLDLMLGMGMPPLEPEVHEQVLDYLAATQGTEAEDAAEPNDRAAEPLPDLPWAEPRYRPNPVDWRRPRLAGVAQAAGAMRTSISSSAAPKLAASRRARASQRIRPSNDR